MTAKPIFSLSAEQAVKEINLQFSLTEKNATVLASEKH